MAVAELTQPRKPPEMMDLPKGFELIDGELVEMPEMGYRSGVVGSELLGFIREWCRQHGIGVVSGPEGSFRCFPSRPKQVRKPDVAVLLRDPKTFVVPDPHCLEVPELVAEILSPTNTQADIADRVEDFLSAGTKVVWVIDPVRCEALVYHPDDTILKIREAGTLDGEGVLPGFKLPLAAILPPK
jgi:Uma2 family endonuclease